MELNYQENLESADMIISANDREIIKNDVIIKISPINIKVMLLLIENQGKVVNRSEIFNNVWPNQEISDDALTRCISDLRAQIGKGVIKTLPKRGYQWVPEVKQSSGESKYKKTKLWPWIINGLIVIFALLIISLWIANQIIKPNISRIAILPIQFNVGDHKQMATQIENTLKISIIESDQLKLLSPSVLLGHYEKPYPYLHHEYGAQWAIEGNIRMYNENTIINLSLVDTRTALVIYSLNSMTVTQISEIQSFCQQFLQKLKRQ